MGKVASVMDKATSRSTRLANFASTYRASEHRPDRAGTGYGRNGPHLYISKLESGASADSYNHQQVPCMKRCQTCLNNERQAIAPEGQEGVHLLLCGSLPFKVEGQGDGGLLQLDV